MQNSVNHRDFERIWHFQVPPGSMFLRVEFPTHLGAPPPHGVGSHRSRPLARFALTSEPRHWLKSGSAGRAPAASRRSGVFASRRTTEGPVGVLVASAPQRSLAARCTIWRICTAMPARRTSTGGLSDRRRSTRVLALNSLHRMEQDYPPNLSISLSGGKETNRDAPSNGE